MVRLRTRAAIEDIRADRRYAEWEGKREATDLFKIRFLTEKNEKNALPVTEVGERGGGARGQGVVRRSMTLI